MRVGSGYGAQWQNKSSVQKKTKEAIPYKYVIVPKGVQTEGYEVGLAIIAMLQHTKLPRVHISQVHRKLPLYIRLTKIDMMQSKSRRSEKIWQMGVHNVKRNVDIAKFGGMLRYEEEFFYLGTGVKQ